MDTLPLVEPLPRKSEWRVFSSVASPAFYGFLNWFKLPKIWPPVFCGGEAGPALGRGSGVGGEGVLGGGGDG